jgi:ribonuclease P protein component
VANKSRYRSLSRRADFLALKAEGHVAHINSWLILNWRGKAEPFIHCGWTIPGHIGPAVIRNRFKRWGREFFRRWSGDNGVVKGIEMNLIFKRKPVEFYRELTHKEFDEALERAAAKLR